MNVDTPATEILSKFVCPSTSKSLVTDILPLGAILSLMMEVVAQHYTLKQMDQLVRLHFIIMEMRK